MVGLGEGQNIRPLIGLHDVGDVAQAQPLGLGQPGVFEPFCGVKSGSRQGQVVEQVSAGVSRHIIEIIKAPHGFMVANQLATGGL